MKFKVDRIQLLKSMRLVQQAIMSKSINPILKNIYMDAHEGMLTLRGNCHTLDITVMLACPDMQKEGTVCIDNIVVGLLDKLPDGLIQFNLGKTMTISKGKSRHRISISDSTEYPKALTVKEYTEIDPAPLFKAFDNAAISVRQIPDREYLQAIHINPHTGLMVTGDGVRSTLIEKLDIPGNISAPKGKTILPLLGHLNDLGEKDIFEISLGAWNGLMLTEYDSAGLFQRQIDVKFTSIEGEFPPQIVEKIKQLKYKEVEASLILEFKKSDMQGILEICKLYVERALSSGLNEPAALTKVGKEVKIELNVKNIGEMSEAVKCTITGDSERPYFFNPKMLLEAINQCSDNLELRFYNQEKTPLVLLDVNNPNYIYVQSLMAYPSSHTEEENVTDSQAN